MTDTDQIAQDRAEITALIQRQFAALCWDEHTSPDTQALISAYLPDASLFASARPATAQTAADFGERMVALRDSGALPVFSEKGRGLHIWITGAVAVALAGCEMHENRKTVTQDISAFLLVRNPQGWVIASQAWDMLPSIADAFAATGLNAEPFFSG
ncbi:nuclear transport factor 2 family protein (plasmid) [Rhodobacteraceae bacterium M382]|nr:nuclear transport factor 2 family protein [Rhodobacteraceae bacterium M382]